MRGVSAARAKPRAHKANSDNGHEFLSYGMVPISLVRAQTGNEGATARPAEVVSGTLQLPTRRNPVLAGGFALATQSSDGRKRLLRKEAGLPELDWVSG